MNLRAASSMVNQVESGLLLAKKLDLSRVSSSAIAKAKCSALTKGYIAFWETVASLANTLINIFSIISAMSLCAPCSRSKELPENHFKYQSLLGYKLLQGSTSPNTKLSKYHQSLWTLRASWQSLKWVWAEGKYLSIMQWKIQTLSFTIILGRSNSPMCNLTTKSCWERA